MRRRRQKASARNYLLADCRMLWSEMGGDGGGVLSVLVGVCVFLFPPPPTYPRKLSLLRLCGESPGITLWISLPRLGFSFFTFQLSDDCLLCGLQNDFVGNWFEGNG